MWSQWQMISGVTWAWQQWRMQAAMQGHATVEEDAWNLWHPAVVEVDSQQPLWARCNCGEHPAAVLGLAVATKNVGCCTVAEENAASWAEQRREGNWVHPKVCLPPL